jgi:tetratricopeptide (TPR) repeat protein
LTFSIYANDSDDINYINKLYLNKYYKESILELEIFLKKHPNSKFYNSAQNLLAYNYYTVEKYKEAKKMYERLRSTEFKDEAIYYITLIADKQNDKITVEENIKNINTKSEMGQKLSIFAGKYHEEKKEYDKAEEKYRTLITFENSMKSEAMLNLGMLYYNNSEYIKSITIFEEYIKREKKENHNIAAALYMLAYSNNRIDENVNAVKNYEKIVSEYKESSYYHKSIYNLMVIYYNQKNNEKALAYSTMLGGSDYEELAFEFAGKISYESGDYSKAEELFKGIWESHGNKEIFFRYILTLLKQEKKDIALKELEKINIKDSDENSLITEYYYYYMFILFSQKKYEFVLKKMEGINYEKIDKNYIEDIYGFIADSAFITGKYSISLQYYKRLAEINNSEKYVQRIIISSYKEKDYNTLDKYFKVYSEKYGVKSLNAREVYLSYGNSLVEREKRDEAEKIYSDYLKENKDLAIQNNRIIVLIDIRKYEEAFDILKNLEENDENSYLKALTYSGLGKSEEAEKIYLNLISKSGEISNRAYEKIIESMFSNEKYEEVIKYCDMYLTKKRDINRENILDTKGKAYLKLKKYEDSLKIYDELIKSGKNQDYGYFMKGEVYYNAKKYEEAKKNYQFIVDKLKESKYRRRSFYWIVNIEYITGKKDAAIKQGEAFLKQYLTGEFVEEILNIMANIYIEKNMYDSAFSQYEKIYNLIDKDEAKDEIAINVLELYLSINKYEDMGKWSSRLINLNQKKIWEAIIVENLGKSEEAEKKYRELLLEKEVGDIANYLLGTLYFKQKKYSDARIYLEQVLSFENSEYKDKAVLKIGFTYEEEKNYQRALSSFIKIKLLYAGSPLQPLAEIKIAENYENMGEIEKSEKIYEDFIKNYKSSTYYGEILERLLKIKINNKLSKEALEIYKELKKKDEKAAQKYETYFKN